MYSYTTRCARVPTVRVRWQALLHVATWRSSPTHDQSTVRGRVVPFPRCVRLLVKHVSTHLLDGAPKVAGSPGTVSQARSQQGTSHGAKAKRHDGLLPAVRAREYRRFFREWFDIIASEQDHRQKGLVDHLAAERHEAHEHHLFCLEVVRHSVLRLARVPKQNGPHPQHQLLAGVDQNGPIHWDVAAAVAAAEPARRFRLLEEEEAATKGAICPLSTTAATTTHTYVELTRRALRVCS